MQELPDGTWLLQNFKFIVEHQVANKLNTDVISRVYSLFSQGAQPHGFEQGGGICSVVPVKLVRVAGKVNNGIYVPPWIVRFAI